MTRKWIQMQLYQYFHFLENKAEWKSGNSASITFQNLCVTKGCAIYYTLFLL